LDDATCLKYKQAQKITDNMPANHKVSVAWQIVFTFITGLNFWAFYRIRKLSSYVLCIVIPSALLSSIVAYFSFTGLWVDAMTYNCVWQLCQNGAVYGGGLLSNGDILAMVILNTFTLIGLALQALAIYLVIIWSRQHNRLFDRLTTQAS